MRTPTLAALFAAALLAGCGGGGSSSSSPLPGSSSQSGSVSTTDIAQDGSSAAFDAVDTNEADAAVGNGSLGTSALARNPLSAGFACRHRRTRTVTVNPDGSVTIETIDYYDNACTEPERDAVAVYASNGGTATVSRTITTYSLTHAQLGVRDENYSIMGSSGSGSWTVQDAFYAGTSSTPLSQFSHSAAISSSTYTGSTGRIFNDAKPSMNAAYGHQFATNATVGSDGSGDTTFTGTRNGAFFKGALNALSISGAPPFTISGGTQQGTGSISGTVAFTPDGVLESVNLTGTLLNGDSIAVTSSLDANGNITVTGTISNGSATVATFTADANGDGILTITSTGAQVPIVDWHVIW
jgi:hypothetical protein